jgi:hypothetical protein
MVIIYYYYNIYAIVALTNIIKSNQSHSGYLPCPSVSNGERKSTEALRVATARAPAEKNLAETILPLHEVAGNRGPVSQEPEK